MLYKQRKQDSVIFVGTDTNHLWLEHLSMLEPSIFRSDCPVFMPIELSNIVELKLDANILFYAKEGDQYNLIDKFSVDSGSPIIIHFGSWVERNGLQLERRINRWERRTDLMGATFVNTLWQDKKNKKMADFIYNENGTIIGSKGWFQEILFYVIGTLNLTVETRETKGFPCLGLLSQELTDICSGGMRIDSHTNILRSMPIAIDHQAPQTLLAGALNGTAPSAWVYITVFGFTQWLTFFSLLLVISLALSFSNLLIRKQPDSKGFLIYEGLLMTSLFSIQQGSHPGVEHVPSKRVLALTTSIVTMLVFIYYSNDITSKMTAGTPPTYVKTFQDVLDHDYKVIVVGDDHHLELLMNSANGSAKKNVYKKYFEEDVINIVKYLKEVISTRQKTHEQFIEEGGKEFPKWWPLPSQNANDKWWAENLDQAAEQIINNPKTLFYCASSCLVQEITDGKVVALKMNDTHYSNLGFALRPDSEYLSLFNHYMLKAFETGILQRLDRKWNAHPPIKIGLPEPVPLEMKNEMFPFSFLGVAILLSVVIAALEKMVKR